MICLLSLFHCIIYSECDNPSLQFSPHGLCIGSRNLVDQPLVLFESSVIREALIADITRIGSNASMLPLMGSQSGLCLKHLAACPTLKLRILVYSHVPSHPGLRTRIITELTLDNLVVKMPSMDCKPTLGEELFSTLVAKK